ncbi:hypothetical protein LSAT2_016047 [Lamellibrachia satsuma]|nr:hypothetical protein LSAT2_016047 [Lamellibrachia satsuma]
MWRHRSSHNKRWCHLTESGSSRVVPNYIAILVANVNKWELVSIRRRTGPVNVKYLTFVRRSQVWNMGTNSSHERAPRVGDNRQQPDIERSFSQDPQKIQDLTRLIAAETNHQHEVATDTYDYRQSNMKLLKLMFSKMDPNIMNAASRRERGDIQLSFKYEQARQLLLVKVIRAKNLDPMDLRGKSADPYVKLFLHPTEENNQNHYQTRVVPKTLNPSYHEIFSFPLTEDQLQQRLLVVQVWDHDLLTPDDLIGEVIVNLEMYHFDREPIQTVWYPLKPQTNLNIQGDIEVSLMFRFPNKLLVTVHGATGLGQVNGLPDPFVKLQVPGLDTVYHTEVQQNTTDPSWQETFEFDVAKEELDMRYVVLHVVDHSTIGRNESLGQVILELSNFDLEHGCQRSFALADLKNNERLASEESQQTKMQEFRESLVAHAAFCQPSLLFQKHPGKKVRSPRSKSLGKGSFL